MTIRTRLAVAVAALCVGAALPASAGAETKDPGAPFTIGFKVTYVDPIGRTAVGVVSCAAPVANGNKARFSIDPQVELYTLAVGDQVMVRVEDRRIVQVTPEQPCDSAPAGQPTDDQPAAGDDHGADPASDDAGDDTNGVETDARPARTGHGPRG